jgi:hypothetical protein
MASNMMASATRRPAAAATAAAAVAACHEEPSLENVLTTLGVTADMLASSVSVAPPMALDTAMVSAFLANIVNTPEHSHLFVDPAVLDAMPGGPAHQAQGDVCALWAEEMAGEHLLKDLIVLYRAEMGAHFVMFLVQHPRGVGPGRIIICDSFQSGDQQRPFQPQSEAAAQQIAHWLQQEHVRWHHKAGPGYGIELAPSNLPLQQDSVSCGYYACLYGLFVVRNGRLPTTADFCPKCQLHVLKSFVWQALATLNISGPLPACSSAYVDLCECAGHCLLTHGVDWLRLLAVL